MEGARAHIYTCADKAADPGWSPCGLGAGGVASGFHKVERDIYRTRLLQVGRQLMPLMSPPPGT